MAGRAGLLPTMGEGGEVTTTSPSAGGETAVEESKSNGSVSGFSRSVCNHNTESMDSFVSSGEDDDKEGGEHSKDKGDYAEEEIPHIGEVTGANAMLTNMPEEDSTALAKRRAIQSVMEDRGRVPRIEIGKYKTSWRGG